MSCAIAPGVDWGFGAGIAACGWRRRITVWDRCCLGELNCEMCEGERAERHCRERAVQITGGGCYV